MPGVKVVHGFSCNNRCAFCLDRQLAPAVADKSASRLRQELARARRAGADSLDLLGGEPTLRGDLPDLVRYARGLGFRRVLITTNGRMLCYRPLAASLVRAGVTEFRISLHGHSAALHDSLTGVPGSFLQLAAGMDNLRGLGYRRLSVNTTVVAANFRFLPKIMARAGSLGASTINLIYGFVPGAGYRDMVPRLSEAAPFVRRCLRPGNCVEAVRLVNWPVPCAFPRVTGVQEDYKTTEKAYLRLKQSAGYARADLAKKWRTAWAPACSSCAARPGCSGICADYLEAYGSDGVRPLLLRKGGA
jgi:MoaA/NifB/PqqE/SkfB family radical SAM enzyme